LGLTTVPANNTISMKIEMNPVQGKVGVGQTANQADIVLL
jgi:hypothetical protein